jgi:hypothetical protein
MQYVLPVRINSNKNGNSETFCDLYVYEDIKYIAVLRTLGIPFSMVFYCHSLILFITANNSYVHKDNSKYFLPCSCHIHSCLVSYFTE